jgi:putative pyruvate formate lyase activating enzyme
MWEIFRLDTIRALENPLIKKILPRYVKVVKDESPAYFQIAKKIPCIHHNIEKLPVEKLWQLHKKLMKKFYKVKKAIDEKKTRLEDLKIPKFSLLDLKILLTREIMKSCELCERKCRINRLEGKLGVCKVGDKCLISSDFMHMGEEFHISPSHTIFFMGCTLKCQYCQNYTISQWYENGIIVTPEMLARRIERMRTDRARNVNFVGGEPTPSLLWILKALKVCEVNVPTLWNSNFYMSEKTMEILNGIIDMYLSDFKYGNDKCALRLSKVSKFFKTCTRNHLLAAKQAEITLRHLILPNHVECCTKPILDWVAINIRNKCIVNIMDQYRPCWKAAKYPEITRRITRKEFQEAINYAEKLKVNYIT